MKPVISTANVGSDANNNSSHQSKWSIRQRRGVDEDTRDEEEEEEEEEDDDRPDFEISSIALQVPPLSRMAILGDSSTSLIMTFILFLMAIVVQQYTTTGSIATPTVIPIISPIDDGLMAPGSTITARSASSSASSLLWNEFTTYESLGPLPEEIRLEQENRKKDPTYTPKIHHLDYNVQVVTPEMIQEYHRDGVICIRGLISDKLLQRLDDETKSFVTHREGTPRRHRRTSGTQFHTVTHSALFRPIPTTNNEHTIPNQPSALMEVALWSNISIVASKLLQMSSFSSKSSPSTSELTSTTTQEETLRVIRDIFLAKDDDPYVCGWHVDDFGFWPAMPPSISSVRSDHGINAWVALDDMTRTEKTGGFALAVQSHTAIWNDTAYNITGAPTLQNFPYRTGGYHNMSHMFQQRIGYGTCNIERTAPHIHQRMEEMKRIYPVQRGDVIFHTRYLFHRTVPIASATTPTEQDSKVYRRYSIRYGIGSTTMIPPGYGTESSVLYDPQNGGQSADTICRKDQVPWYPQAYPHMEGPIQQEFWKQYTAMRQHHIPMVEQQLQSRKQEMRPYLRQLAQEQSSTSTKKS